MASVGKASVEPAARWQFPASRGGTPALAPNPSRVFLAVGARGGDGGIAVVAAGNGRLSGRLELAGGRGGDGLAYGGNGGHGATPGKGGRATVSIIVGGRGGDGAATIVPTITSPGVDGLTGETFDPATDCSE